MVSSFKSTNKVGFLYHAWFPDTQGRYWLSWRSHSGSNDLFSSFTRAATLGGSGTFGIRTFHNYGWTGSLRGVDLMADGYKIRGADITTRKDEDGNPFVVARVWQNVDGLYNWVVADSNDWPQMRDGICASLAPASPCPTCLVVSPPDSTGSDPEPTDEDGNHHYTY
ncbi:MAG: hypothetical protein RBU45_22215 [Myxococcota bacterium]|nr:hypothetical protein [Myxococcota bacterium]